MPILVVRALLVALSKGVSDCAGRACSFFYSLLIYIGYPENFFYDTSFQCSSSYLWQCLCYSFSFGGSQGPHEWFLPTFFTRNEIQKESLFILTISVCYGCRGCVSLIHHFWTGSFTEVSVLLFLQLFVCSLASSIRSCLTKLSGFIFLLKEYLPYLMMKPFFSQSGFQTGGPSVFFHYRSSYWFCFKSILFVRVSSLLKIWNGSFDVISNFRDCVKVAEQVYFLFDERYLSHQCLYHPYFSV